MTWDDQGDAGFTLIEVMVVVTLSAIFALMVAGGLRFGVQAEDRVNLVSLHGDGLLRVERYLRDRLDLAQPVWVPKVTGGHVDFAGSQHSVAFLAPTPNSLGGIGLSRYVWTVIPDGAFYRLRCRVQEELDGGEHLGRIAETDTITSASIIQFSYYGRVPGGEDIGWQADWVARGSLPTMISINISDAALGGRANLEVLARPRIDVGTDCQLDPQTADCVGH